MKVLALLALLVATAAAAGMDAKSLDVSGFLNDMAEDINTMDESSCGCGHGCRPTIIRYPMAEKNKSSVIQPVVGNRGNVALIVYWGTCSPTHKGYTWYIDWGDGKSSKGYYDDLLQVQSLHQYDDCGYFRVTARYCSSYKSAGTETNTRGNCDYYTRVIDVTFDPPAGI
ncbi:uncharacterized protein LOC135805257 [Sycon ciliatum]|uniref:uncharacterized protein LOC135805257 n=1 Tax=Sycon ciliatum TaxID=27933 RepID=UPI0031F69E31